MIFKTTGDGYTHLVHFSITLLAGEIKEVSFPLPYAFEETQSMLFIDVAPYDLPEGISLVSFDKISNTSGQIDTVKLVFKNDNAVDTHLESDILLRLKLESPIA